MSPEEFNRIKEAEKEHLRALKKLKQAVRQLERQRSVTQAVQEMNRTRNDVLDTHEEMVEKLALDTARQEARLEIALEANAARPDSAPEAAFEEDLQKARAQALIRQLKLEMGTPDTLKEKASAVAPPEKTVGKTIGRTHDEVAHAPDPIQAPEPLPEKTIGRMKP